MLNLKNNVTIYLDRETKKIVLNSNVKILPNLQFKMNILRNRNASLSLSIPSHLRDLQFANLQTRLNELLNTLLYGEHLNIIYNRLSSNALYRSRIFVALPRKDS